MERTAPVNLEAECAVLGALLSNNKSYQHCIGLKVSHFADPANAAIYGAIQRRLDIGRTVDAVSLKAAFEQSDTLADVGGTAYLVGLLAAVIGTNNVIRDYADVIRDCALRRNLAAIGTDMVEAAHRTRSDDGDGATTARQVIGAIEGATAAAGVVSATSLASAVQDAVAASQAAQRGEAGAAGLMTGIKPLDDMWCGLHRGSLDIIGGRSGEGKTSLALQIARNVARGLLHAGKGGHIGIISMEMRARDVGLVNLSSMSSVPADLIRGGKCDNDQASRVVKAQIDLASLPISIIDQPGMTLAEATGMIRALTRQLPVRGWIVDHRDLFARDEGFARANETAWYQHVSQSLKATALAENVWIGLLVQLSRDMERREDPRPRKSDLKYAGEADADNIVLLFRPELHMGEAPAQKGNETGETYAARRDLFERQREANRGVAEVIFAKRRFGPTGLARLNFDGPATTFSAPDNDGWPM